MWGHDRSSLGIESQGHIILIGQGQRSISSAFGRDNALTRSV